MDQIDGGAGSDRLTGGAGDDTFAFTAYNGAAVTRGFGQDTVVDFAAGDKLDLSTLSIGDFATLQPFIGQNGPNTVLTFGWGGNAETITLLNVDPASLNAGSFIFRTLTSSLNQTGTSLDDVVFGGLGADTLQGSDGGDDLIGGAGADFLDGGNGSDYLMGGAGADIFAFTAYNGSVVARGFDQDTVADFAVGDKLDLSTLNIGDFATLQPFIGQNGPNTVLTFGWGGNAETITLLNVDPASLNAGSFIFRTLTSSLNQTGTSLDDVVFGGLGADTLQGSAGGDDLIGGAGADFLDGGSGSDYLMGGGGADTFAFTAYNGSVVARGFGQDTVADFAVGDKLDLSTLNIGDFATLRPFIGQNGANTVLTFGWSGNAETITLLNVNASSLSAGSFTFRGLTTGLNLSGTSLSDVLFGGLGSDTLQGGNANDVLVGGAGSDVIDGGAGADVAAYGGGRSGQWVSYSSGTYHVNDLASGATDSVTTAEYFSFGSERFSALRVLLSTNAAIGDYNGDGHADILWRNQASGVSTIWQMDGAHTSGGGVTSAVANTSYSLLGTGDFDGDHKSDLLWRNDTNGATVIWKQNGTQLTGGGVTSAQVGTDWYVAGIADFDGDGKSDLLWRNLSSGGTVVWTMNGQTLSGGGATDGYAPNTWSIAGTGDFSGDGKADILWRNTTDGATVIWTMNGQQNLGGGYTSAQAQAPWAVAGVADFNGDGKADLLWRNAQTNETAVWTMNGTSLVGGGLTDAAAPAGWSVVGTGDFNGDGKADILWRNDTTEETVVWQMNANHVVSSSYTDTYAPDGWAFT